MPLHIPSTHDAMINNQITRYLGVFQEETTVMQRKLKILPLF